MNQGEDDGALSLHRSSAFIFVLVAVGHLARLFKQWAVKIGPFSVSMSMSWVGLVVGAFSQFGVLFC
jgi:hypothetical protein